MAMLRLCNVQQYCYAILAGLGLYLSACSTSEGTITDFTPTPSTVTTAEVAPSVSPSAEVVISPSPSEMQPTLVLPTPASTLTSEQRTQFLEEMLRTNGKCRLPCWWGGLVLPGETSFDQANALFSSWGIPFVAGEDGTRIKVFAVPPPDGTDYEVKLTIANNSGVLQAITMDSSTYSEKPSHRFTDVWQRYDWSNILTDYGIPTSVFVWPSQGTYADLPGYWIMLTYRDQGIAMEYWGPAEAVGDDKARACPLFQSITRIKLTLISAKNAGNLSEFVLGSDYLSKYSVAMGIRSEEFYKHFEISRDETCFEGGMTVPVVMIDN